MKNADPFPPAVRLATPESLRRRDPARHYGRWLAITAAACLLASIFVNPEGGPPFANVSWSGGNDALIRYVLFPVAALVPLVVACCLGRIARGVLLLVAGLTALCGVSLFFLWNILMQRRPELLLAYGFLVSTFLLIGGFDAGRRRIGRRAARWAPLAPALAVLGLFWGFAASQMARGQSTTDAVFFWLPHTVVRGLPDWFTRAVNAGWLALLAVAIALAAVHALRPKRGWAIAGLLCAAAGALTFIGFTVFINLVETGFRPSPDARPYFYSTPPLQVFRTRILGDLGGLLLALGYSTLWRVSREKKPPK